MSAGGRPQGTVETGRTFVRREYHCESCKVHRKVGKPKPGEGMWPARLHIAEADVDNILIAAAEFDELCEEAGEYATAVAFVDWLRPDATSPVGTQSPIKAEPPPVSLAEKRRRHAAGAA